MTINHIARQERGWPSAILVLIESCVMKKEGYTFTELMVVVLIMGVMAAVAIPRLQFKVIRHKEADSAARKLVSDLRRARSLALRDAASNSAGYRIHLIGSAPFSGYNLTHVGTVEIMDTVTFDTHVTVTSGIVNYKFGPLGNLTHGAGGQIEISSEDQSYSISIVVATGAVILTGS